MSFMGLTAYNKSFDLSLWMSFCNIARQQKDHFAANFS